MFKVVTSNDDEFSPEIAKHRDEAFENGYDDALDDIEGIIEEMMAGVSDHAPERLTLMAVLDALATLE